MIRPQGLTLVEVLIAILILAVGVLGAMLMQTTGLRATRTSQVVQSLNSDARSQIDLMRLRLATEVWTQPMTGGCDITGSSTCSVEIRPCIVTGGQLDCNGSSVSQPAAHAVTVNVSQQEHSLELSTIVLAAGD